MTHNEKPSRIKREHVLYVKERGLGGGVRVRGNFETTCLISFIRSYPHMLITPQRVGETQQTQIDFLFFLVPVLVQFVGHLTVGGLPITQHLH